jgi:hypothetical protein
MHETFIWLPLRYGSLAGKVPAGQQVTAVAGV